jgi:hypothetical protein
LIGSHGEIHSGAIDVVDSAPIKPAPREKRLRADDDTALHIRRRNFERCPVEDAARLRPQTVRTRHINAFYPVRSAAVAEPWWFLARALLPAPSMCPEPAYLLAASAEWKKGWQ